MMEFLMLYVQKSLSTQEIFSVMFNPKTRMRIRRRLRSGLYFYLRQKLNGGSTKNEPRLASLVVTDDDHNT